MKTIRSGALLAAMGWLTLAAPGPASAQAQDIKSLAADAAPTPATLADFKGLIGDWAGPMGVAAFSAPLAGQMVGHLYLLNDATAPRVEELWIIRPEGASVLVRQKHYTPDLKDREEKDVWAQRRFVGADAGHIYLDNVSFLTGGQTLTLLVRVPGRDGAPPTILNVPFKRVR